MRVTMDTESINACVLRVPMVTEDTKFNILKGLCSTIVKLKKNKKTSVCCNVIDKICCLM